jgi:hypothetical protein
VSTGATGGQASGEHAWQGLDQAHLYGLRSQVAGGVLGVFGHRGGLHRPPSRYGISILELSAKIGGGRLSLPGEVPRAHPGGRGLEAWPECTHHGLEVW